MKIHLENLSKRSYTVIEMSKPPAVRRESKLLNEVYLMQKKIRAGIVGAGMMGRTHTEALRRLPGVEVAALADSNTALAQKTCEELFIPACYGSYQEMIEKENLDVVHVCTPNFAHFEVCKAAIEAGVNVYCEKPLANTPEQTAALCALARQHGVLAAVNFNYRHNAVVQDMRERVQSEDWGRTFLIHGSYIQDWMMYDSDYNWRCVPALGGASRTVADIGSHWFDTVQYITGRKIVRVYAKLMTVLPQRKKFTAQAATFQKQSGDAFEWVDIDTEDGAFVLVQLEDGTLGNLVLSQVSAGYKNGLVVCVDGSRYSMTWEQETPDRLYIGDREAGRTCIQAAADSLHGMGAKYATLPSGHVVAWNDALRNAIGCFYSELRGVKNNNFARFDDGDYIVKIVEACLRSDRSGNWEDVQ